MPSSLTLLMAQINPTVGAIARNKQKIIDIIQSNQHDHDIIIFPELALTGYPLEDLLYRKELFLQVEDALEDIKKITKMTHVIVGHPVMEGKHLFNALTVFSKGMAVTTYYKQHLPNYGVFDESRYFTKGAAIPCTLNMNNYQVGFCICEDIWHPGPMERLIEQNVDLVICINASPFENIKYALRETLLQNYTKSGLVMVYVNQVGGQDELVFDGQSLVMNANGTIAARAAAFKEELLTVHLKGNSIKGKITPLLDNDPLIYEALICGLRDYVEKNKFKGVLLGLSGGIDSALTLSIAVDALGPSRVKTVMMPSCFTSPISLEEAERQATLLQVDYLTLPIEPTFNSLLKTLAPAFKGLPDDSTEENLQARIRGTLLMALSNKMGFLLLSTSNKSETAVGYCTLYGDMAGGFAPLKDVLKTTVYALAHYRNSLSPNIPPKVISRAPSAELKYDQTDQDSLPDYATLDGIIKGYMEDALQAEEIRALGYDEHDVYRIIKLIQANEFKRYQAPPGTKITPCSFGRDWRYPITSGFHLAK